MSAQGSAAGSNFRARFNSAAQLAPRVNTSDLAGQGSAAGRNFGERFSSSAKLAMTTLGLGAGVAGLAAQFKQVMSVGMDWTRTMNTFTAVTGASADELKKAGDAARALGNDVSLPATSANDAAAAMTELAKGGFTVQQAMDAAKGSLQLAAAAGISATDAATIQSQALQAFGLDAKEAGKMSDTLANAANASSAEITDVAYALQASGTVANQFGLSAQDTAAAIALLANNGIKGSDAGTLLKSSLLALTDQGKPAQAAIKELGLAVYDAQGRFVGLHSLYGQLGEAAKRMTQEDYQAATAVLFGSDAMRIAGVAAKDGSASYDRMRVAIERQGAAADVAAAKTQGLPGAWERFKNTVESLQLQAYDKLEGPLTKVIDGVSHVPDKLSELAQNPQVQSLLTDTRTAFVDLANAAKQAGPGLVEVSKSLGSAAISIGGAAWKTFVAVLESTAAVVKTIAPALKVIGDMMSAHQGLVTAGAAAWLAFKLVPGILGAVTPALNSVNSTVVGMGQRVSGAVAGVRNFGDAYRTSVQWMAQANPTVSTGGRVLFGMGSEAKTASAHLRVLGDNARSAVGGGLNMMKGAASGIVGALGGPFSAALVAAGTAFAVIAEKNDAATTSLNNYNEALKNSKRAQNELNDALIASGGQLDENAMNKLKGGLAGIDNQLKSAAERTPTIADEYRDKDHSFKGIFGVDEKDGTYADVIRRQAGVAKDAQGAIDNLKLAQDELAKQVAGGQPVFDALVANLQKQGAGGVVAAEKIKQLRIDLLGAQQAGATANPVLKRLGDDVVGTASQIKTAFDAVPKDVPVNVSAPGGQAVFDLLVKLGQSVSQDNDKNIKVDAPLAPDVLDTLKALGYEVKNNNGKIIVVKNEGVDEAKAEQRDLTKTETKTVRIISQTGSFDTGDLKIEGQAEIGTEKRLFGAIVPMADGGLRWARKPQSADIYAGRGAGTIFAEEATGGEAYIPLAPNKRQRSMAILAEVARRFGITSFESGGISVDELKSFASNIAGNSYNWGGGNGDTFSTDCSGAQSTIANFITGASGRFATASESSELLKRGFQAGDPPDGVAAYWVGWENGGPGGGHTAGTIVDPDGGNVNVEMGGKKGGGQFGGGAQGASAFPNRAWIALAGGDNGKSTGGSGGGGASTSQVMSAQASVRRTKAASAAAQKDLDDANAELNSAPDDKKRKAAEKKRDNAQRRLDSAVDRQATAEQRLTEVLNKKSKGTEKSVGGDGGVQSFGQSLVSGLLQGIGLDGSVFSNPLEWPNVKSGLALLNWGAGYAKAWAGGEDGRGSDGNGGPLGGALSSLGLPNIAPSTEPKNLQPIGAAGTGTGPLPGPAPAGDTFNVSGVNPREIMPKIEARQWAATNRHGMGG
ncbi:phage tail tape measure protein [Mycobacterium sp. HM-7]